MAQIGSENGTGDDFARELARMKLRAKVEQIKNLPTLPQVVSRLLSMMMEDTCSAGQLSQEISKDQSLTAKILKVVNSAYYGFHRQISMLTDAVVILGIEEIQRLTATIAVFGMVHIKSIGDFSPRTLWEHSIATATGAEMISNMTPHPSKGAFVCGLLHDIGKVVFDQFFNQQWKAIVLKAQKESLWIGIPEAEEFGTHHGEVGAWLTERWSLPPWIVEGIRYHHETQEPNLVSSSSNLWLVVQLADRIAREENFGSGGDKQMPPAFDGIEDYLGVQPEQIEDVRQRLTDQMTKMCAQWDFLSG